MLIGNCASLFCFSEDIAILINSYINTEPLNEKFCIASLSAISTLVFWREEYTKYFSTEDNIYRLYSFMTGSNQDMAYHSLAAIENIGFRDSMFSINFLINTDICLFLPPDKWDQKTTSQYCQTLITIIQKTTEYHKKNPDNLSQNAINHLFSNSNRLILLMINYSFNMPYKIRKNAVFVLAQCLIICERSTISLIITGKFEIIDMFMEFLECKDIKLISIILQALSRLCNYGDEIAIKMDSINPFLQKVRDNDIFQVLNKIQETYMNCEEIISLLKQIRERLEQLLEYQSIDTGEDVDIEINI